MSKVKGVGLKTSIDWIKANYGEEGFKKVLEGCTASSRQDYEVVLVSAWYPTVIADALYVSFVKSGLGGSGDELDKTLLRLGLYIAETNLSTLYKVVFYFVKPNTMLGLLPRMWKAYFDGITLEVEAGSEGPNTGTCRVKGLGDFRYISPVAGGWIDLAYRKVGARDVVVSELNYRQDSPG